MGKTIKIDQRGRVLLPQNYREYEVFDLEEERGRIVLTPLKLQPVVSSPQRWGREELSRFIRDEFLPRLAEELEDNTALDLYTAVLFGSHAKKSALSHSDIDVALLVEKFPSFKQRQNIHAQLNHALEPLWQKMRSHKVNDELSLVFLLVEPPAVSRPPIYDEVATHGKLIWEREKLWRKWKKEITK